jgi:dihydroorotate dehydrogenase electron transfer subunit
MTTEIHHEDAEILLNKQIGAGLYLMRLRAPDITSVIEPAQFIQVQTDPELAPFLRRPFSALRVDRDAGWMDILFDVIGRGTARMAAADPGTNLNLLGPLGLPFSPPESGSLLLVAGGVGIVPLAFLTWEHPELLSRTTFLMGAANRDRMPDLTDLLPAELDRHTATDDGSLGHHGFVTDLISEYTGSGDTTILTCGPHPMMARVAAIADEIGLSCFASLENHMACGFGACVGCVVEYREAEREDLRFRKVCTEGPVVDAHAIVW